MVINVAVIGSVFIQLKISSLHALMTGKLSFGNTQMKLLGNIPLCPDIKIMFLVFFLIKNQAHLSATQKIKL